MEPSSSRTRVLTLLGTAAAAATAAFVASRLGIGGTIVGAALVAVIASIGAEVYTTAAHRTTERVAELARAKRAAGEPTAVLPAQPDAIAPDTATDADIAMDADAAGSAASSGDDAAVDRDAERTGPPLRFSWMHVAGVAGIVFLVVVGGITALELIAGKPLSSWWTDDSSTGTTIGQVVTPPKSTPSPTPSPSEPSVTPSPSSLPTAPPTTGAAPTTLAPTPTPSLPGAPTTAVAPAGTVAPTP